MKRLYVIFFVIILFISCDKNKTGTTVRFLPDKEVFSTTDFSYSTICERMQESAFLLKGLTVEVIDEIKGREAKYHYDNGIKSFVEYINEDKTPINNILHFKCFCI